MGDWSLLRGLRTPSLAQSTTKFSLKCVIIGMCICAIGWQHMKEWMYINMSFMNFQMNSLFYGKVWISIEKLHESYSKDIVIRCANGILLMRWAFHLIHLFHFFHTWKKQVNFFLHHLVKTAPQCSTLV